MTPRAAPRTGACEVVASRIFALFVGLSLVIVGSACATSDEPVDGAAKGLLGVYVGFNEGQRLIDFEEDLGAPVDLVMTMADSRGADAMVSSVWGQFAAPDAHLPSASDRLQVVASVPIAFGPGGMSRTTDGRAAVEENLRAVAAGRHDEEFRLVARYLVNAGYDDAIIRLGHEFDADWAPYSARGSADAYVSAFRHVHDVLTSVSPAFRFDWTSTAAHFVQYGPAAYPGDDVVDMIGLDVYWRDPGPLTEEVWQRRFESVLRTHLAFAQQHDKPVSYPEWGRSLADEPSFVDFMHDWFDQLPRTGAGRLEYQAYFNEVGLLDDEFYPYDLEQLPNVKSRYVERFGAV